MTDTPRHLHAYWDGPPLPDTHKQHLWTWTEMHPAWGFTLWDSQAYEREFGDTPTLQHYRNPVHWSPRSNPWQWRTNIARYHILHQLGGAWFDTDMEPRQPIDHLMDGRLVAAWEQQDRWINNAFLACPPGHPAITAVVDGLPAAILAGRRQRSNMTTGAKYITDILRGRDDVNILDQHLVYPYSYRELHRANEPFPDAIMVHRWHNTQSKTAARRKTGASR